MDTHYATLPHALWNRLAVNCCPMPPRRKRARPSVLMPGQAMSPEIRFSPGMLSEAHIL